MGIQETHSTEGNAAAIQLPEGVTPLWSHGSRMQGGIALIVQEQFLKQFRKVTPKDWEEIVPGRLAVLHLEGPQGRIAIATMYFASGHRAADQRSEMRQKLRKAMAKHTDTLWLMMGDFNWVTKEPDRLDLMTGNFTGDQDREEEAHWQREVAGPGGLQELTQKEFTYQSTSARSRLDRAYTNHHTADYFAGAAWMAAWPWPQRDDKGWAVSDHRPISFGYRRPEGLNKATTIKEHHIRHPDFAKRVVRDLQEKMKERIKNNTSTDPFHKLDLIKEAMQTVSDNMTETNFGKNYIKELDPPATAGTAFSILAGTRSGTVGSKEALRKRLPSTWERELGGVGISFRELIKRLKDKAIELTKQEVMQDMRKHQEETAKGEGDENSSKVQKNSISRRLAKLSRKTENAGIHLLEDGEGGAISDEGEIANKLQEHWAEVFKHKEIDGYKLTQWKKLAARAGGTQIDAKRSDWKLRKKDVEKALKMAGDSRPGPDGIPFSAWRALGPLGITALWEAGEGMASGLNNEDSIHNKFNESLLCCLPKQPTRTDEAGTQVYVPSGTRPLSITNTDNRIVANAYRLRWEPLIAPCISKKQRGFIGGRSMISNIIDAEHTAMTTAMESEDGAIILFDFVAAFPSVSRHYLQEMARAAGFPEEAMNILGALYHNTVGTMMLHGTLHGQVPLQAGIRQGCPLSPLLFALASDSLLRILDFRHPTATTRAFADDTAMIIKSWRLNRKRIFSTFAAFAAVSNLMLNLLKTVVIPLWECDVKQKEQEAKEDPTDIHISWANSGKYLGYYIGPGKGSKSWEKPAAKYKERLGDWAWSEMGLNKAISTYNTYVLPVLLFVAQLESPPQWVLNMEKEAVRRVAPGPGAWCSNSDLHHGRALGLDAQMRPMLISAQAAMLRVHAWEGLPWTRLARQLADARSRTDHLLRAARCKEWLLTHMPTVMTETATDKENQGISKREARRGICRVPCGPLTRQMQRKVRRKTQSWFVSSLLKKDGTNIEERVRKKLARWKLEGLPGRNARKVTKQIGELRRLVPPRVRAATLSTIFNRWTTDRRMKKLRQHSTGCVLGCPSGAEDSIEHYLHCPIWRDWAGRRLGGAVCENTLQRTMLAESLSKDQMKLQATATYVLYRTVHHVRRQAAQGQQQRSTYIKHFMDQQLHEATRDDSKLRNCCSSAGWTEHAKRSNGAGEEPPVQQRSRRRTTASAPQEPRRT